MVHAFILPMCVPCQGLTSHGFRWLQQLLEKMRISLLGTVRFHCI